MAVKAGPIVNLQGPIGPPSITPVNAPPGPNVGVVGGYALWGPSSGNGNVVLLYGPKLSTGWPQTQPDAVGNTYPVSFQLTGAVGAKGDPGQAGAKGDPGQQGVQGVQGNVGATGAPGSQILPTSGVPQASVGNVGDLAIDQLQGFVYGPKSSSGWSATPLVSTVGPAGPKGDVGPAAAPLTDYTANSFVVSPVSGSAKAVQFALQNSSGTVLFKTDASGNTTMAGTLTAIGAATLAALTAASASVTGNASVGGTFGVTGASALAGLTCSSLAASSNATVAGTLGVSGASTLASLSATSISASGTLSASGTSTLAAVNASNVSASGTLSASGASTLAAVSATNVSASGTLSVSGATTLAAATSTATVQAKNLTLTSGGGGVLTFADGTTMATAASGTGGGTGTGGGVSGVGGIPSRSVVFMGTFWNNAYTANTSNNTYHATLNTNGNSLGATGAPFRFDIAGAVVGYSLSQAGPITGNNTIQLYKNGTAYGAAFSAGSGAGAMFGDKFANSVYTFAAGDVLTAYVSNASGGNTQVSLHLTVEWLGATLGGAASMDLGFYWPGSGAYPTSLTVNTKTITSGNSVATVPAVNTVQTSGTIVGINGLVFGSTGGKNYTFALYKNGSATGLTATVNSTSNTGPGTVWQSASGSTAVNYAAGDYLQIYSMADSGATSQATYAYATYATAASSVVQTTAAAASSGSSGGASADTIFMGTSWFNTNNAPTSYTNFVQSISRSNGYGQEGGQTALSYAGNVLSIQGWANGTFTGTVNVALYKNGAITPLVATVPSVSGGGVWSATVPSGSPISFNAGDVLCLYIKSSTTATDQAFSGHMTVQPLGAAAVAANAATARSVYDMGGYQYPTLSANAFAATKKLNATAGSGTINTNTDLTERMPWPGSIVGYSVQQNSSAAATTNIAYSKNGTQLGTISVGSGAGSFSNTHAVGTYSFVAGDKIQFLTTTTNGGNTDVFAKMFVQWSA
jgi:hypothetical protein